MEHVGFESGVKCERVIDGENRGLENTSLENAGRVKTGREMR